MNENKWTQDWARMSRLEKIEKIIEKQVMQGKKLSVYVQPPTLILITPNTRPEPSRDEDPE